MELNLEDLMNGHRSEPASPAEAGRQNETLSEPFTPAGVNPYLHDPEQGLKLCADLIKKSRGDKPHQLILKRITKLIDEDFLALASTDKNDTSTRTFARLQTFKQRLVELANFPVLEKCYTVAVGGAFSAGKSRFLNSVLGCPSLLPTDTTPTTSIPTFISQGDGNRITALNSFQKQTDIDEDALGAICHAFNDRFGVTFSHLLQLISVERESLKYPSLAFLDTPGYSKTDNIGQRSENTDENIAREQLSNADYLVWLVDIQNGTVPKPDIDFIASLESKQPVLVVFSKADKKPESQVRDVLNTARRDLDRAELAYHDIIAYSAQTGEEISGKGDVLTSMLDTVNSSKRGSTIIWQLNQVMKQHISDYQTQQQSLKLTLGTVNELLFDDNLSETKNQHLSALQQKTKSQLDALTRSEKQARDIQNALQEAVTELCELFNLTISEYPSSIQLQGSNSKSSGQSETESFTFTGLLNGDTSQLANRSDLSQLPGSVKRISPVGVFLECGESLEAVVTKQQLKMTLGDTNLTDIIQAGMPVTVQISGKNKCLVHIDISVGQ